VTLSFGTGRIAAFDHDRYVPVLLTRQGERHALRELSDVARNRMTPLFVVHPIDRDNDTGRPVRTVAEHLEKLAVSLARDWGSGPAFVDLRYVDTETDAGLGTHPLAVTPGTAPSRCGSLISFACHFSNYLAGSVLIKWRVLSCWPDHRRWRGL